MSLLKFIKDRRKKKYSAPTTTKDSKDHSKYKSKILGKILKKSKK